VATDSSFGSALLRPGTRIEIVDVRGRIVRVLAAPAGPAVGEIRRAWDGRDSQGRRVASGRYWARIRTGYLLVGAIVPLAIIR
jgi:hypothetical protein